jgi:hypothetical protein
LVAAEFSQPRNFSSYLLATFALMAMLTGHSSWLNRTTNFGRPDEEGKNAPVGFGVFVVRFWELCLETGVKSVISFITPNIGRRVFS